MPSEDQSLHGLWSYTAFEECGVRRSPEQLATMAKLVLLVGEYLPGWDGLWAAVSYGYEGGSWPEEEVGATCRHLILGERQEIAPACDFYFWAGGRFRIAPRRSPKEIDLEQYWRGEVLPSLNLGLYTLEEERLILCLADNGKPRPLAFSSSEQAHQSLGELTRGRTPRHTEPRP
jgi:hypothetical protein